MKLSWSHRLFFQLNRLAGRAAWFDACIRWCAGPLFYIIIAGMILWWLTASDQSRLLLFISSSLLLSYVIGFGAAFVRPHPRPSKEFPEIRALAHTLGTWKSFPSDHTIAVAVFAMAAWKFHAPPVFAISLTMAAAFVAVGRVLAGVHYPRDIVGGLTIATISSITTSLLMVRYGL